MSLLYLVIYIAIGIGLFALLYALINRWMPVGPTWKKGLTIVLCVLAILFLIALFVPGVWNVRI